MSLHNMRVPFDVLFLVIQCTEDKCTLYRLAMTCRTLSIPAISELWHTMDSLVPLALLIPPEFFDQNDLQGVSPVLKLPEARWVKFQKGEPFYEPICAYGKYIKVLRGIRSKRFGLHFDTLQFLLGELPYLAHSGESIVPNLTKLSLKNNELDHYTYRCHVRGLLVPNLRYLLLTLTCQESADELGDVIPTALDFCPNLVHLKFVCTQRSCSDVALLYLKEGFYLKESLPRNASERENLATRTTSLRNVHIIPANRSGYCDILCTPSTLVYLGLFKSITHLRITLDTSPQNHDHALFEAPNSAFPSLQYLRLRLLAPEPITWFFDAIDTTNLKFLYLHIVLDLGISDLLRFVESLSQFKEKFSMIVGLGFRATVYGEEDLSPPPGLVIVPVVVAARNLFPSLSQLKLKLFPSSDPQRGLIKASHIPYIVALFPHLKVLKLASNPLYVELKDVVALARGFPGLRKIGMNFQLTELDFLREDEMEDSPSHEDGEVSPSGLRTLYAKYSQIISPELVATYLRKNLPKLSSVVRSRKSIFRDWDIVDGLVADRR